MTTTQEHLHGEIVAWHKFRKRELLIGEVRQALKDNNLPLDVASDLSAKSAFGRACSQMKQDRQIDKLNHEGGIYQFQLTQRAMQDNKLEFVYEAMVTLHGETGKIECPESYEIQCLAEKLFAEAMINRTMSDVTKMVQKLFEKNADLWPICPEKGVAYFVPEKHRDFTDRVRGFVNAMGGELSRFPVPKGNEDGDRCVKDAFEDAMKGMIGELNAVVDGFDETTREDTMTKTAEKFQHIAFKLQAFAEYNSDRVERALDAAKQQLRKKVLSVADLKEKKETDAKQTETAMAS